MSVTKRKNLAVRGSRRSWDAITEEEFASGTDKSCSTRGTWFAESWSVRARLPSRASGSTSTRAIWRSPWFAAGMSRRNSRTPSQRVSSRPRRRWEHFCCCCLMRPLGGRQAPEVAKFWWWTLGRRTCTLLPNAICMWHSRQKYECQVCVHE